MPFTPEGRARISAAVAASNSRRGEQDQTLRAAKRKFTQHRANAKLRGVDFLLAFDEWWDIWRKSGKWAHRGKRAGQYCMSRFGDEGAYAVGNVFINLTAVNVSEGVTGIKRTVEQNAERSGWMRGNKHCIGRRWMHNGRSTTCVSSADVAAHIANGWIFGRKTE